MFFNKHKKWVVTGIVGLIIPIIAYALTPNMNLDLPQVGVTTGPEWATMLNEAFETVDSHDHSSGKGVQITPNGLNINSDLSFGSNDATALRTSRYTNLTSSQPAAPTDIACTYFFNGELWANSNAGSSTQLTSGGYLNASALNSQSITASKISSGAAASGLPLVANGVGGASFATATIGGNITSTSTNYQILDTDTIVLVTASGGVRTVTLPDPTANSGKLLWIVKMDSSTNIVNILPFAGENINETTSFVLKLRRQTVLLTTQGSEWIIL